jgi:copper chaperone CopZ
MSRQLKKAKRRIKEIKRTKIKNKLYDASCENCKHAVRGYVTFLSGDKGKIIDCNSIKAKVNVKPKTNFNNGERCEFWEKDEHI